MRINRIAAQPSGTFPDPTHTWRGQTEILDFESMGLGADQRNYARQRTPELRACQLSLNAALARTLSAMRGYVELMCSENVLLRLTQSRTAQP